jgi:hypothetical protein
MNRADELKAADDAVNAANARLIEAEDAAAASDLCRYTAARVTPEYFPELAPLREAFEAAIDARAKVRARLP